MFWDKSRRSLVELVLNHVQRSCGTSSNELLERRRVPSPERWLWDFASYLDTTSDLTLIAPNGVTPREDDLPWWWFPQEEAIFGLTDRLDLMEPDGWTAENAGEVIEQIVKANGHDEIFGVGREFARLIFACNRFDAEFDILTRASDPNDSYTQDDGLEAERRTDEAHLEVAERFEHVLGLSVVRRCHHAGAILAHELSKRRLAGRPSVLAYNRLHQEGGPVPIYGDDDAFESEVRAYFEERWSHASAAAWLAFGDVLGTLRETDLATAGKDKPLPSLRAYQLTGDSSVDRVRAALQLAERELGSEVNTDRHPEIVVACVAHGIEALARRLWPSDFSARDDSRRTLVGILDQKRKFAKIELEQRFSTLALSLYTAYRKPAIHDPDRFRCTWAEAHFFVSGMRVLFDISEQLVHHRGT